MNVINRLADRIVASLVTKKSASALPLCYCRNQRAYVWLNGRCVISYLC
jgi:hypothetical protein